MISVMFTASMMLFVFFVLLLVLHPKIPTGNLGSLGLLVMGVGAVLATDDSLYSSTSSVEWTFIMILGGAMLCILQFLIMMRRNGTFSDAGEPSRNYKPEAQDGIHLGH